MTKEQDKILEYLKNAHVGAKACGDFNTEFRVARAILAFEADINKDIFKEEAVFDHIRKDIETE